MFDLFGIKKLYLGPIWTRKNDFKFFLEDIPEKRGVSVVVD